MKKWIRASIIKGISICPLFRKAYNTHSVRRTKKYISNEEEVAFAEESLQAKQSFNRCFKEKWPEFSKKTESEVSSLIAKAEKQGIPFNRDDVLFCTYAYGFLPEEYFCYHFFEKTAEERKKFISMWDTLINVYRMNDAIDRTVYSDKAQTFKKFYNYFGRDGIVVASEKDYPSFLSFIENKDEFVKKPVYEEVGRGIELIRMKDWRGKEKSLFVNLLQQGKLLLEEKVIQSEDMAAFHSDSVNTVRFISFLTKEGVEIPFCFMKTGRNGSFVDNAGAGGIFVGVDPITGITITDGFDEIGKRYVQHPDTGNTFMGFQLPEFQKALDLCRKMAVKTPSVRFIGWDLAHTKDGWVVIEGNSASQFIGPQTTLQYGVKAEVDEILSRMDLIL